MVYLYIHTRIALGGSYAKAFVLGLIMFCSLAALAQTDTAKTKKQANSTFPQQNIATVIVSPEPMPYTVTRITPAELADNRSNNLADVLTMNTNIHVRNYGPGLLSTVSFRGTGAEHTVLLWNGLNMGYPFLGLADFATTPINTQTNVEIIHGSTGAYFGNAAIGGAINMSTNFDRAVGFNKLQDFATTISYEYGSFGRNFGSVQNYFRNKKIINIFSAQGLLANNNFPYINTAKLGFPTERQVNSGLQQGNIMNSLRFLLNTREGKLYAHTLDIHAWYVNTARELPPTMTSINQNARQDDESVRLLADYRFGKLRNFVNVKAGFVNDRLLYQSDVVAPERTDVSTYTLNSSYRYTTNKISLNTGIEGQFFYADVDGYNGIKTEWRANAFAIASYRYGPFNFTAAYRHVLVQGFIGAPAPALGGVMNLGRQRGYVKASAGRSYRVPTLNERFWNPGGNPNLTPEGGWAFEVGYRTYNDKADEDRYSTHRFTADVNAFYSIVDNWIQWYPLQITFWEPVNLKQVMNRGVEVDARYTYRKRKWEVKVNLQYTLAVATNTDVYVNLPNNVGRDLMYTPRHVLNATVNSTYNKFNFKLQGQYTGMRYTAADNSDSLPGFFVLNARVAYSLAYKKHKADFWVQANNALNTAYQVLDFRAMPGVNFRVGLTFYLSHKETPVIPQVVEILDSN